MTPTGMPRPRSARLPPGAGVLPVGPGLSIALVIVLAVVGLVIYRDALPLWHALVGVGQ